MSRIYVLVSAALALFSTTAMARQQTTSSAPSQNQAGADQSRTAEITIRGCISGGKRYSFMQASTGAMFALTKEQADRFAPVRGKLIEITADEFAPQPKSDELPKLKVNTLHIVADKCPIQARAASRPAIPSAADQGPPSSASSPDTTPHRDPSTVDQTPPNVNNPNNAGDNGAPSAGTGNPPSPPQ
jgi:hypothetical protein